MNTHLLIPIGDIKLLTEQLKLIPEGTTHKEIIDNLCKREAIMGKLELITQGKQISLDDKDIEEKVNKLFPEPNATDSIQTVYKWSGKIEGYKKALNDLK
jgi:hypothetical protein